MFLVKIEHTLSSGLKVLTILFAVTMKELGILGEQKVRPLGLHDLDSVQDACQDHEQFESSGVPGYGEYREHVER